MAVRQYIGARYVTKVYENSQDPSSAEWEPNLNWEPLIIVTYNNGSYMSKKFIPASVGNPADNPYYWTQTGFYNGQIATLNNEVADIYNRLGSFISASSYPGATDAQKLQAAINDAITGVYNTIIIDKVFDLGNDTLYIDKGYYDSTAERMRYRQKLTFIAVNEGKIKKSGPGYFFSATTRSGDVAFINVPFEGNVVLDNVDDVNNREQGNNVFDCSKLLRISTFNCSYCLVKTVFDGTLCNDNSSNMQSCFNFGDVCTYSAAFYSMRIAYDVHLVGCLIENCNDGLRQVNDGNLPARINTLIIDNCCIEGCTESAMRFDNDNNTCTVNHLSVNDSYFESNGFNTDYRHISINCTNESIAINSNRFALSHADEVGVYILICTVGIDISNNMLSGASALTNAALIDGAIKTGAPYVFITANDNDRYIYKLHTSNLPARTVLNGNGNDIRIWDSAAQYGLTNAGIIQNHCIIHIRSTDSVTDLPLSSTEGVLYTISDGAIAIQFFVTNNSGCWMRARLGAGWSLWYRCDT